ncbi:hypothetical protein Q8F55_008350 [Vanrija albida]|uniref:Uncharacterized protein n=1 Tax=Vanrija albida TaxID=181172 RepID=A0ABR3PW33_9TREE
MSYIFYLPTATASSMALIPDRPLAPARASSAIPDAGSSAPYLPDLPPPPGARLSLRRARDVARALESPRAAADGEYRLALLKSYIDFKLTYHPHAGLRRKLRPLERAFPQYRGTFCAARAFYCLPPGRGDGEDEGEGRLPALIGAATALFATAPAPPVKTPRPSLADLPPAYSEAPLRHDDVIGHLQRMVEAERFARCAAEQRVAAA